MSSLNRILDPTFKESLATELVLSDIDEYKEEGMGGTPSSPQKNISVHVYEWVIYFH